MEEERRCFRHKQSPPFGRGAAAPLKKGTEERQCFPLQCSPGGVRGGHAGAALGVVGRRGWRHHRGAGAGRGAGRGGGHSAGVWVGLEVGLVQRERQSVLELLLEAGGGQAASGELFFELRHLARRTVPQNPKSAFCTSSCITPRRGVMVWGGRGTTMSAVCSQRPVGVSRPPS